jgi:DNA-binding NarL/FixJ family response regulator
MSVPAVPPARTRLFLVDDHQLFLEGLRVALESRYDVVGVSTKGLGVVESCRTLRPDVVLLDLSLPDRSGLEIVADLHAELPDVRVIVVTMHADRVMANASLQSGARGFVPKDSGMPELETALTRVMAGERYVSDRIPRRVVTHSTLPNSALGISQLTPRQRVIVRLIGEGKRTVDIAEELGVTRTAITWHRVNIRKALGLESEWELLRYAILVRMSEEEGSTPPA